MVSYAEQALVSAFTSRVTLLSAVIVAPRYLKLLHSILTCSISVPMSVYAQICGHLLFMSKFLPNFVERLHSDL